MGIQQPGSGVVVFRLLPNPVVSGSVLVHLEGLTDGADHQASIDVFDALGQRVLAARANAHAGVVNHRLDTGRLRSGVYVVQVSAGSERRTDRLVVQ